MTTQSHSSNNTVILRESICTKWSPPTQRQKRRPDCRRSTPPSKKNSVTSAARIEKLCEFYISPGFLSEKMFVYLATGLRETEQQLEEDEVIEIIRVTFDVRITND
jgi:hypothetical protein